MIKKELLDANYYINKLSMFMRESYGIIPQINILIDWMNSVDKTSDLIASMLDIWNEDYLTMVEEICGTGENEKPFLPLDVIASIVGCSRENIVEIPIESESEEENEENLNETKKEIITLNNEELLELIKIKILQNNYDGSLEAIKDLYINKLRYNIYYSLIPDVAGNSKYQSASCNIYLDDNKIPEEGQIIGEPISENIKKIFKYSDFFIESLGIVYNKLLITDIDKLLILNLDYGTKYHDDPNKKALYDENYVQNEDRIVLG